MCEKSLCLCTYVCVHAHLEQFYEAQIAKAALLCLIRHKYS